MTWLLGDGLACDSRVWIDNLSHLFWIILWWIIGKSYLKPYTNKALHLIGEKQKENEWDKFVKLKITIWVNFEFTFYNCLEAYIQEDYFLALNNLKKQDMVVHYMK